MSATVSLLPGARDESLLLAQLRRARIVAVVTVDDVADAAPLAGSLTAGGITAVELALRTPAALAALCLTTAADGLQAAARPIYLRPPDAAIPAGGGRLRPAAAAPAAS